MYLPDGPRQDALPHLNADRNAWPVMDSGRLAGTITLAQVEQEMAEGRGDRVLGELLPVDVPNPLLTSENFPHLHMDHPLDMALRRMAHSKLNVLPVVGRADIRDLKGVVSLKDILEAYGVAGEKGSTPATSGEIRASRRLVPGVIAAGLAVLLVIGFLNYYYRSARSERAEEYYKTGNELLQQDRDEEAVQQFRDALSAAPGNPQYRLALGLALVKAQHSAEGSVYLSALLKRDPENAPANLGEARIAAANGQMPDAAKLYRRAIDGVWPAGQERTRIEARQELAALLAKSGQIREAADAFREVIKADDRDANAFAGLGEADLALENYQDARNAFEKAVERNPSDEASKKGLALSERILALDPNARGLRVAVRYERSKELLREEVMQFEQCQPGSNASDAAKKALESRPSRGALEDSAEMNLSLAEDLWKQGQKLCGASLNSGGSLNSYDAIDRRSGPAFQAITELVGLRLRDVSAAIFLPAIFVVLGAHRLVLAVADGGQLIAGQPQVRQILFGLLGPRVAQRHVVFIRSAFVAIALPPSA